jgi:hypothetical protein
VRVPDESDLAAVPVLAERTDVAERSDVVDRIDGEPHTDGTGDPDRSPPSHDHGPLLGRRLPPLLECCLIGAALGLYLAVRALTRSGEGRAVENAERILRFERTLGIAREAAIQGWMIHRSFWIELFNDVYAWLYWPTLVVVLVWLYRRDPARFVRLRNAFILSGLVGLLIFARFPTAPPRLLAGFTDTFDEMSRTNLIAHPSGLTNPYAAMPSFHAGWTLLACALLLRHLRRPLARALAMVPPVLMVIAVIVTANHFVLDVVVGAAISFASLWVVDHVHLRRRPPPRPATVRAIARAPGS